MESTIFPLFVPIYRRRPYCVVDFCHVPRFWKQSDTGKKPEETRKFINLKFYSVADFRNFSRFWKQSETGKKRETSKIGREGRKMVTQYYCVVDFCHVPRFWKQSDTGKKPEETRKFINLKFYSVADFRNFSRFWKQSETGKKRETSKIGREGRKMVTQYGRRR